MEIGKPTTMICTLLAMDQTNFCYRVCSVCERTLPDNPTSLCNFCNSNSFNSRSSSSKLLFRILVSSIWHVPTFPQLSFLNLDFLSNGFFTCYHFRQMSLASDTKVFTVICFDRAAKVLFGCTADEFFDFAKLHPFSGNTIFLSFFFSSFLFMFWVMGVTYTYSCDY